jgi:hypothetical protein
MTSTNAASAAISGGPRAGRFVALVFGLTVVKVSTDDFTMP